ncbi:MAG TPA: hypothetical protein VFU96_04885 [Acidimicrobiia bacterium]|nr:hypothetical protein [Acidimicrobiia bacterium]
MLRVRNLAIFAAALLLTAASLGATAFFTADGPGSDLRPVGGAEETIQILQGNRSVLWTALSGSVGLYRVEGWPVSIDGNELGGALVIERPTDGSAGVIEFGEKPKSIVFDVEG